MTDILTNQTRQTWTHTLSSIVKTVFSILFTLMKICFQYILHLGWLVIKEIHEMELLFIGMCSIYTFLCQLLFLTMCEITILGEPKLLSENDNEQGIIGLSALLFYNVFGYFVKKIQDICQNNWSRITLHYSTSYYLKWILKIILEWVKAVAVVLCIRDKGITYEPDPYYTSVTFLYYTCTEKLFIELVIKLGSIFNLAILDHMEHLYIPIILNIFAILCSAVVTLYMCTGPQVMYAIFASYFIIYLRAKDLYFNYIRELLLENETYASFRTASSKDIENWDDICAVCLNRMSTAMITPCNHLFHPYCLKQCLRTSLQCPLCKHDFIQ